jgi:Na+/alanine symporter
MAIPNVIALYVFAPRIKGLLKKYQQLPEFNK